MEAGQAGLDEQRAATLAQFIHSHKSQILALWEGAVRRLPTARELSKPALLDSVPELLDAIARAIAERGPAGTDVPRDLVEKHAFDRLDIGFNLGQVVAEYSLLRYAILDLWERASVPLADRGASLILHRAIDESISLSVERFTQAQLRTGRSLDRIATASLESHDLDDLLRRLLAVVLETMSAVDTAAILLREEGDVLRVRAAVGLEREVELGFSLRIGEGFAGTIAASRRPLLLKSPTVDPLVKSAVLRESGIRALYGVPLIEAGEVIGVAHVGSLTAHDFSEEDRRMVAALASRATAGIYQQMLRQAAEHRAAELRAVIESIPDAVFIADRKRITMTNRRGLDLLGAKDREEALLTHEEIRKRIRDAATGRALGEMETGFARAFKGETTVRELVIVRGDGSERIIRSAVAPIELGGTTEQAVSVTTDITEAKRYERERAELLHRTQDAVRTRERVLAIVSHDLRNPLSAVKMAADIIVRRARDHHDARLVKHAETIGRSASRMERLIGDLLDMASIQVGKLNVVRVPQPAAAIVQDAIEPFETVPAAQGIRFTTECDLAGLRVDCDRERILQVFSNLLGNAFKFSRRGDQVTVRARRDGDQIRFEVADTGPGIASPDKQHVFEPYWSAERQGKRGTGLGLFITRGVIEAHGGKIWVESEPGRGATFVFTLPLAG